MHEKRIHAITGTLSVGVTLFFMAFIHEHSSLAADRFDNARYAPILAANVKRLRKKEGINKKTFALMLGIGRPFLNKIESGVADVRLSVIVKMADTLRTTPQDLLTDHTIQESKAANHIETVRHARLT